MLNKVGKFIIPIDFIVLNYNANNRVLIILTHLFFVIGKTLIGVREGTLKIRLDDEEVVFKVYKSLNPPFLYKELCMVTAT